MKISKEEVQHVARLARLDLDEAAIEKFAGQIGEILDSCGFPQARRHPGRRPPQPMLFP